MLAKEISFSDILAFLGNLLRDIERSPGSDISCGPQLTSNLWAVYPGIKYPSDQLEYYLLLVCDVRFKLSLHGHGSKCNQLVLNTSAFSL